MRTSSPDRTRRPRLGVFGVGRMGLVHVETLIRLACERRIEFVAIGDRREASRTETAERVAVLDRSISGDLKTYSQPEDMAEGGLDAAIVASRTEDHARDALAFTSRGIPVLVEKPLAGSIAEAAAFCAALGPSGDSLVQVGFQRGYDAATRAASRWVAEGLIGDLQQTSHVLQDKNPTPAGYQSCGITADMAIHLVYEAMSFRGFTLPRRVQAIQFLAPHYEDRAGEGANIVHAFCTWDDGSLAHLWGSRINRTGYDNRFTLVGTRGRIDVGEFVGDFGIVHANLWCGADDGPVPRGMLLEALDFPMTRPNSHQPDFYARFARAYEQEVRAFAANVAAGQPLEPSLEIGWKTLLVANLAEASSRRGGQVFDLGDHRGTPVATAADAARYAAELGVD
ncbi:MAG: Gfo/Idh/MocA family oxidoreductase [Acidobacteria bacterium]|nr:Gfo/Idh/MocA family oxidoreductase [Acidobacteriota bacterium]